MSTDMLSPFEIRPWVQLAIVIAGAWLCWCDRRHCGRRARPVLLLALLPASIADPRFRRTAWQAVNPLMLVSRDPRPRPVLPAASCYRSRSIAGILLLLDAVEPVAHRRHAQRLCLRDLVLRPRRRLHVPAPQAARHRTQPQPGAHRRARRRRNASRCARRCSTTCSSRCASANTSMQRAAGTVVARHSMARHATRDAQLHRRTGIALGHARGAEHDRQHADSPPAALRPARRGAAVFEILRQRAPNFTHGFAPPTCARWRNSPKATGAKSSPPRCGWKRRYSIPAVR